MFCLTGRLFIFHSDTDWNVCFKIASSSLCSCHLKESVADRSVLESISTIHVISLWIQSSALFNTEKQNKIKIYLKMTILQFKRFNVQKLNTSTVSSYQWSQYWYYVIVSPAWFVTSMDLFAFFMYFKIFDPFLGEIRPDRRIVSAVRVNSLLLFSCGMDVI